jgi:hypothetical protein
MGKKNLADILRDIFGLSPANSGRQPTSSQSMNTSNRSRTSSTPQPQSINQPTTNHQVSQRHIAPEKRTKHVEWGTTPAKKSPSIDIHTVQPKEPKVDWGGVSNGSGPNLESLIGVEDAYEHTPLLPGERIAFCIRDKVAYHLETWEFLKQQNQGLCCICKQSNVITIYTLPGTLVEMPPSITPAISISVVRPGEKVIGLTDIWDHVNCAVTIQGYVYKVYKTQATGTYFIRFEPLGVTDPVYAGFKVVIFPEYQNAWTLAGISINSYERKNIYVRGLIEVHSKWGIEILVNSPRVIEVIQ